MSSGLRAALIALCVLAIFYLAYQLAVGLAEDPEMQATPAESIPQEEMP